MSSTIAKLQTTTVTPILIDETATVTPILIDERATSVTPILIDETATVTPILNDETASSSNHESATIAAASTTAILIIIIVIVTIVLIYLVRRRKQKAFRNGIQYNDSGFIAGLTNINYQNNIIQGANATIDLQNKLYAGKTIACIMSIKNSNFRPYLYTL